jgi:hypothetical protein
MHRDEAGRLHLSVAVTGPWSQTLGYDLDWLYHALPPRFLRWRKMIDWENVWFLQVQLFLPAESGRSEPVQLHVSSVTGTIQHEGLMRHLVDHADGVVFAAQTTQYWLDYTLRAHGLFREWHAQQPLVYQFDDSAEDTERFTPAELASRLAIGDHPWFHTHAYHRRNVREVFREITSRLVRAKNLRELPLVAPIAPLQP